MKNKLIEYIATKVRPIELRLILKKIMRIKRRIIEMPDQRKYFVDPLSDLGLHLMKNLQYEPELTALISTILKENDTFVDVGSNEGFFSVLAGKLCGKGGKIIAVEPQQQLWSRVQYNCFLNSLTNVQLIPFGIAAEKSEQILYLYPDINSGASSYAPDYSFKIRFQNWRRKIYGKQLTKLITIDELLYPAEKQIKLIKIDIEGYEYEALKGAKKILKEKVIQHFLIEIHSNALESMNQSEKHIDDFLFNHGYKKNKILWNLNHYTNV